MLDEESVHRGVNHGFRLVDGDIAGFFIDVQRGPQVGMGFQVDLAVAQFPGGFLYLFDQPVAQAVPFYSVAQVQLLKLGGILHMFECRIPDPADYFTGIIFYDEIFAFSFSVILAQAVKAFNEAEAYDGPSLIICYAHCIAHGINMTTGLREQQKAVNSGAWLLYRYNPTLEKPLQLDSKAPTLAYSEYAFGENRFRQLKAQDPATAEALVNKGAQLMDRRFKLYQKLSDIQLD